jgi:hypothetical protein
MKMYELLIEIFGEYKPYYIMETVRECVGHVPAVFSDMMSIDGEQMFTPFNVHASVCTDACTFEPVERVAGTKTNIGYVTHASFVTFFMAQLFFILRMIVRGIFYDK